MLAQLTMAAFWLAINLYSMPHCVAMRMVFRHGTMSWKHMPMQYTVPYACVQSIEWPVKLEFQGTSFPRSILTGMSVTSWACRRGC